MKRCAQVVCRTAGVFLAVLVFCCMTSQAQTFRGTILGTVTDQSGASVSGATVTVRNLDTGLTRETTTSDDGSYSAPELPIGNYSVTVEKSGFKAAVVSGIRVEVSSERRADVVLQPGEVTIKVEVSADTLPLVESTSNTLGGIVESSVVANLPLNGRDYQKLIFMVPGVSGSPDMITDSPGSFGIFSLNGARGRANNYLLDGTDMNDGYRNDPSIQEAGVYGTPATILPVEAVAELRVLSNFEPEYGRSAGGVINVVTKSGTNDWHGSVLEYVRNTVLNARNYFNPESQPQQPFHLNQFGGALGGPIVRDRTFFFVNYEGLRETGGLNYVARVPSAQEIADATAAIEDNGDTLNPIIAALLARNPWPAPNNPVAEFDPANNIFVATPFSNRVDSAIIKIDHNFARDHLFTGRYYLGDSDQSFPLGLVGGSLLPGFNVTTPTRVQLVSLSYVSVLSPSLVNESRLGWNRFTQGFFPEDRSFDPSTIGLNTVGPGTPNNGDPYNFGLPRINVGSYAQIGANNTVPRQRVDTNWHYIDNVSWKAGRHDVKFGYEFRRTSISQILNALFRGALRFSVNDPGSADALCTDAISVSLCQSLEQFLVGTPTFGLQAAGDTNRNTFQNSHGIYFQDSFRWTRRFTLNLGLRWDYYGIIREKKELFTNIDPATGLGITVGSGDLYEPDYNNVAPRLSVAWDVSGKGKTVLRAGYGFFYDAYSQDFFIGHLPFNSFLDPGPAYAGFGPSPILEGFADTSNPLTPGVSPFSFGPLPDAFGVDRNLRTPYMQNYNLNVQQEITKYSVLQVGYVGSNGRKLFRFRDINQPDQAAINAFDYQDSGCCVPRRFEGAPSFSPFFYINFQETSANSNYNALQVSYRVNNWRGFTTNVNYTWSHSIDTASDGEDFVSNASQPNDSTRPALEKGNSNFDVRQKFVWNFIYQLPNWKGSWSRLTDGWGINGVLTLQAGQPFHVNYNFQDDYDGSGEFFGRPDVVGPIRYNRSDPFNFLDLSSFAVPCTFTPTDPNGLGTSAQRCTNGSFHFGSLGRNSLRGPDFRQFDFSIYKDTAITERLKIQFRAEFYNLFNHPNFANPYLPFFIADAALNGISDGTATLPQDPCFSIALSRHCGSLPLFSTGDVGIGYPFLGGGAPRGIQLAVKLLF